MNDRVATQREAVRRGLQLRRSLSIPREHAVNVFDLATSIGVDIQFLDLRSLEGMFYRGPDPKVILPSLKHRSRGRVAFSCAHELGHFDLGHGTRVDEYIVGDEKQAIGMSLEELAADTFATTLLMPRAAVLARFSCRDWQVDKSSALQVFQIAGELDVGYATLCRHLRYGLGLVSDGWINGRIQQQPKAIRARIAPRSTCSRLVVVDQNWPSVPLDLEIGDLVSVPGNLRAEPPQSLSQEDEHDEHRIYRANVVGESTFLVGGRQVSVRVARTGYCGLLKYRYLEDKDE